jgi:hypothetical protein
MADISTDITTWSSTAGNNQPTGSTVIGTGLDDNLRAIQAGVKAWYDKVSVPTASSLGGDVAMNNTANYFDGPSIAQGTSGTWFVSGQVSCTDTAGAAGLYAKLWDGTTVIASAASRISGANQNTTVSLSGYITNPAGNLRISCRDTTSTSGVILFNNSGLSKDSTITAIRVA